MNNLFSNDVKQSVLPLTDTNIFRYVGPEAVAYRLTRACREGLNQAVISASLLNKPWVHDVTYDLLDAYAARDFAEQFKVYPRALTVFSSSTFQQPICSGRSPYYIKRISDAYPYGGLYYIGADLIGRLQQTKFPLDLDIWQILSNNEDVILSTRISLQINM